MVRGPNAHPSIEQRRRRRGREPLKMHAEPSDHAGAFVLLASRRDSKAMTGTVIESEAGLGIRGLRRVRGRDNLAERLQGRIYDRLTDGQPRPARAGRGERAHRGWVRGPWFRSRRRARCARRCIGTAQRAGLRWIVHAAGRADDRAEDPADVMSINLLGTWNVLLAAERLGIKRVVYFSSGKSIGMLEREPDYLPVDDDHRGLPTRPYGLAKWLSEEMCQAFTQRTGIDTICLRAVAVFDSEGVDVRDVADATVAASAHHFDGQVRLLFCVADIADRRPTLDLVAERMKHVPWRGGPEYKTDPYRGLVDISHIKRVLGFKPKYPWPGRVAGSS
jgi:UDP-glucose 4-epimerase